MKTLIKQSFVWVFTCEIDIDVKAGCGFAWDKLLFWWELLLGLNKVVCR